jgi:hypothetical protein
MSVERARPHYAAFPMYVTTCLSGVSAQLFSALFSVVILNLYASLSSSSAGAAVLNLGLFS